MPGVQNVLDELHSVCQATAGGIAINEAAVQQLAARLVPEDVKSAARRDCFPIKFDSVDAEITFLALYRLLDFGSEFDHQLRAAAGRGARETMQFGVLGLHLGAKRLDRHFLKSFNAFSVTSYFGFEPRVDEELQPGITISKPGPLQPLCDAIKSTLNAVGEALERKGERTLGQHILAFVEARQQAGEPPLAAALVADLASSFPGFDDTSRSGETWIPFHRKAQALAGDLQARFGSSGDGGSSGSGGEGAPSSSSLAGFAWEDAGKLAGDSGALAAAAWRELGVVSLPERLAQAVDEGKPLEGDDETTIRVAAVTAADAVAAAAGGSVTAADLGAWAASLLDEGGELHQKARPHVTPGATAY